MPIGPTGSLYRRIPGNWQRVGIFSPAAVTIQATTYTAVTFGTGGQAITITILAGLGVNNRPLSVSVTGNAITISPATNGSAVITSTQAQVQAAVVAHAPAAALVTATGGGATTITAVASTPLAGGSDYVYGRSR